MGNRPFLKEYRVQMLLFFSVAFIGFSPFVPVIFENIVGFGIVLLLLFAMYCAWAKAWVDVFLAGGIALTLAAARLIFNQVDDATLFFRVCGSLAFLLLNFALFIGPWSRFTNTFLKFYRHRRHVGVTAFLLALTHVSYIFNIYFDYSLENAFQAIFIFFGFTALYVMLILAVTSWDYLQKHVNNFWWGVVHSALLFGYSGFVYYFWKIAGGKEDFTPALKMLLVGFLAFWLFTAPWGLMRRVLLKINGWKQLHVLIYIAYVSVILHVWVGVVSNQAPWLKALFWTVISLVFFSHFTGWCLMLRDFFRRRAQKLQMLEIDGKIFYKLDAVANFVEGKGRRFDIAGVPVAAFLHQGKVRAVSNVCSHQGGPICKGRIRKGYIECPWHGWQFSPEDGKAPPGYHDKIPAYEVLEKEGAAYVAVR